MKQALSITAASLVAIAIAACAGTPDNNARVDPKVSLTAPDNFAVVSDAMVYRCGSIDCHGSKYRNMRFYGYSSERLDAGTEVDQGKSTPDEVYKNYEAMAGVEPEIFAQVIADKGANPERLTLYRKALGLEAHRAGTRITPGEDADICLKSFLASNINLTSCQAVTDKP